jgi:3-methyladenine DNA glycosylase AlkD
MATAQEIISEMTALKNDSQRAVLMRFFKTGKGEYGEGDMFLGLKNPQTRAFVKKYFQETELSELDSLIHNPYHEIRLCGFLIMVEKFSKLLTRKNSSLDDIWKRDEIIQKYLDNLEYANNWDLVDLTAPKLLGRWYFLPSTVTAAEKESITDSLASSSNLWKKRVSMVFTWATTREKHPETALKYAIVHLGDPHDLMQKAVGWMLREVGKICSQDLLREFLADHINNMSRTTLRYAIEKFDEKERRYWLDK